MSPRLPRAVLLPLLLLAIASAQAAPAAPPAGRSLHGVDLPAFVRVQAWDAHLRLAGVQVVDHHYMPFQVVALYVGAGAPDAQLLAAGLVRCRIEIHSLGPALDEADARAWWDAQFARAVPDAPTRERLAEGLQRFARTAAAPARGTVTALDYDPDGGLSVIAPGAAPLRVTGLEMVRAILGLWLRPGPGRDAMLGAPPAAQQ